MLLSALDTTSDEDLAAAFRHAANRVSSLGQKFGFSVRAYDDAALPLFSALSLDARRQALKALKGYLNSLLAGIHADKNLDQPHISTWWAFSALGLRPNADLFRHFRPDTMIEVYTLDNVQIWRNFEFFRYNSYTIEEIHCLNWEALYDRGAENTAMCFEIVSKVFTGETELFLPNHAPYVLTEKCSRDRNVLKVEHYLVSALKDRDGNLGGYLVGTRGDVIAYGGREVPKASPEPRPEGLLRSHLRLVTSPDA